LRGHAVLAGIREVRRRTMPTQAWDMAPTKNWILLEFFMYFVPAIA